MKEGTEVPDYLISGRTIPAAVSVTADAALRVAGYVSGNKFFGKLVTRSYVPIVNVEFQISADIELLLR